MAKEDPTIILCITRGTQHTIKKRFNRMSSIRNQNKNNIPNLLHDILGP